MQPQEQKETLDSILNFAVPFIHAYYGVGAPNKETKEFYRLYAKAKMLQAKEAMGKITDTAEYLSSYFRFYYRLGH